VIDFGSGHKMGNVSIGNVGRDIVSVTINSGAGAFMHNPQDFLVVRQSSIDG
jgi:hypothetical protein